MKRLIGLCLLVALGLTLAGVAFAQEPAKKENLTKFDGNIVLLNKDKQYFTLQMTNRKVQIFYDEKTLFTTRNQKGATAADLKEGRRVICLVDTSDKDKYVARRIDFRETK